MKPNSQLVSSRASSVALVLWTVVCSLVAASGKQAPVSPPTDIPEASRRAEAGDVKGMVELAYLYLEGSAVTRNLDLAVRWYRAAAERHHPVAMNNYGWMHEHGIGVERNAAEAARWYRLAAEAGDVTAMTNLGQILKLGLAGEMSADDARWHRQQSAGPRPPAVVRNDAVAMSWLRKAAQAGDGTAMANLVEMYRSGRADDAPDNARERAVAWAEKAAAAGNPHGLYVMSSYPRPEPPDSRAGRMYTAEEIAAARTKEAIAARETAYAQRVAELERDRMGYLRRAGSMGHSRALSEFATLLTTKQSSLLSRINASLPPRARAEADRVRQANEAYSAELPVVATWLRRAADANDGGAMARLGVWYCHGIGVAENAREGLRLIQHAVDLGSASGYIELAEIHGEGSCGQPRDPAKRRQLLEQLANHPDRDNAAIGRRMVNDQVAEAALLARQAPQWETLRSTVMLLTMWIALDAVSGGDGVGSINGGSAMTSPQASRTQRCEFVSTSFMTVHGSRSIMGGPGTMRVCR